MKDNNPLEKRLNINKNKVQKENSKEPKYIMFKLFIFRAS